MIPFSVLDLSSIVEGASASDAFRHSVDLARHAERWGYTRYWLAEHHSMPGIASAATSVVIGHVAGATSTIRVGSGGIMLPNHAPLVIAEQFGTLASLYPGRIDLGLGRAPGTDGHTARALRRGAFDTADTFPQDVVDLKAYFSGRGVSGVQAVPGAGLDVPLWLLGSSLFSASLAAELGLPFAFASHFAPDLMERAIDLYRSRFAPSAQLKKPYVMLGVNVFAADTDREGERIMTSIQQQFYQLRRGSPGKLRPPVDSMEHIWDELEAVSIRRALRCAFVGSKQTVRDAAIAFIAQHQPDELMLTSMTYDHAARLRSFEIAAEVRDELAAESGTERTLSH
ncbi:LLM class flavin-dependent oxidoreductase [Pararobbsia silviterrae]|uniref:Luciferase-like monooxygenase n=1 Tax=Pararobbsia silviterrae TaxID=1792498 RepID=A0A494Y0Z3_9BURK|nr:LLM class flavin-dependent oxidoreductase [Pararobbsia silviterrae]RKP55668.1 LLM class flavin-dependent oxidoreductase [Pararobbsia silviterrae]